ncbi:MAG: transposase, partial [Phycisphaerae bacterium]
MSHDAYFEIYLHIVWHTKGKAALLRGPIERAVHDFLRERIISREGAFIDQIGGTDDHVHLAVHVAPTIEVANWIGELKGSCSHYINTEVAK